MECPSCNATVSQTSGPEGGVSFYCRSCGWGTGAGSAVATDVIGGPSWGKLGLMWLVSAVIVVGPYLALRFGVPYLTDVGVEAFDDAAARFVGRLNVHYWWVIAAYVFLSGIVTPNWDPNDVGWMGGWLDNPFSLSDDYNRTMRTLAFLLIPGRIVWKTLTETVKRPFAR